MLLLLHQYLGYLLLPAAGAVLPPVCCSIIMSTVCMERQWLCTPYRAPLVLQGTQPIHNAVT